jgi:hypothetical protein
MPQNALLFRTVGVLVGVAALLFIYVASITAAKLTNDYRISQGPLAGVSLPATPSELAEASVISKAQAAYNTCQALYGKMLRNRCPEWRDVKTMTNGQLQALYQPGECARTYGSLAS